MWALDIAHFQNTQPQTSACANSLFLPPLPASPFSFLHTLMSACQWVNEPQFGSGWGNCMGRRRQRGENTWYLCDINLSKLTCSPQERNLFFNYLVCKGCFLTAYTNRRCTVRNSGFFKKIIKAGALPTEADFNPRFPQFPFNVLGKQPTLTWGTIPNP